MFDEERFAYFFELTGRDPIILYGYYDSTLEIERESVMFLTDIDSDKNNGIFAHELAHYWWDRLCVVKSWRDSPEAFAVRFHRYYEEVAR
jgi:hypothetical protein